MSQTYYKHIFIKCKVNNIYFIRFQPETQNVFGFPRVGMYFHLTIEFILKMEQIKYYYGKNDQNEGKVYMEIFFQ